MRPSDQAVARTAPFGEKANASSSRRSASHAIESLPVLQSQTSSALCARTRFKNNRVEFGAKNGGMYRSSSILKGSRTGEGKALPSAIDQRLISPSSQAATRTWPAGENRR